MTAAPAPPATYFAPAPRLGPSQIAGEAAALDRLGSLGPILDAIPDLVMVLNAERQILFGNRSLAKIADSLHHAHYEGMRPGELLACRNAAAAPSGCGTGESCRTCGAVLAILDAQRGGKPTEECRLVTERGDPLDLRVDASAIEWDGRRYVLLVLRDISHEKRRAVLERVFFHDVLNTAGGVLGLAQMLSEEPSSLADLNGDLLSSATALVAEIQSQRTLVAAENGELLVTLADVPVGDALARVHGLYRGHPAAAAKHLVIEGDGRGLVLSTDAALLDRVLGNLVKNALEACAAGQTVRIGAWLEEGRATLWCHNPGFIPLDAQRQIFHRSYSTKGVGRGIGTYSVRLLVDRYLRGNVSLHSSPSEGTRFSVSLPLAQGNSPAPQRRAAFLLENSDDASQRTPADMLAQIGPEFPQHSR